MLFEELVAKAAEQPEYDWESYYRWLVGGLACQDAGAYATWMCRKCFTVNITVQPAAYGKCRGCSLIYIPERAPEGG